MNGMQLVCTKISGCQQKETNDTQPVAAKPIIDCVWRGCFCIGNEEYGPLYGHLSNKACEKVCNVSKLLPPYLRMEKLPRLDAWPNSFKTAPPTDDSIGLYFFPECARVATVLDQLLGEVINKDLVLKFVFDNVELLVFSATILPIGHQRFQGEYYLWGAFRAAQVPLLTFKSDCNPDSNGVAKVNQTAEVSLAREKEEVDGSNVFIGHQDPPLPLKSRCPSKPNEVAEEIKKAVVTLAEEKEDYIDCCDEVLSDVTQNSPTAHKASRVSRFNRSSKPTGEPLSCEKGREEKPMEENFFPTREELEEGEICDVDYSICENLDEKKEDNEFRLSQTVDDKIQCLELFPLQVEDIGIVGKVGAADELNLDLGLSCTARSRVPYEDTSDARSKKNLCRLL
ncbi:uncharacterized protein M6B38_335210 [Iris pallida]|uniref:AIPP2-like SPOC-like domain-containing protein n=1 Tax=Iris pallida TaxID=29817 RepID=A0AAX6H1G1_IRIPA|nr:uncharacterized protein M6B38_335210 [Iris pallida]